MEKNLCQKTFIVLIAGLMLACGDKSKDMNGFGESVELSADSVAIQEILQPRRLIVSGDKMLIHTSKSDSLVYVYQLPGVKFLYAGIRTGGGPGELSQAFPEFVNRYEKDGNFTLLCNNGGRVYSFIATDTGFVYRGMKNTGRVAKERKEGYILPVDSMMVDNYVNWKRDAAMLFLYDMNNRTVLDSINSQTVYSQEHGGSFQNSCLGIQNKGMYAAVYSETGRVEFYDISEGKLNLKQTWGDDTPAIDLKNVDFLNRREGFDYYVTCTDEKYLYILETHYRTQSKGAERDAVDSYVLVYDWGGRPIKKYHLDKLVDGMLVGMGKLYAFNWNEDFEKLYVYNLDS